MTIIFFIFKVLLTDIQVSALALSSQAIVHEVVLHDFVQEFGKLRLQRAFDLSHSQIWSNSLLASRKTMIFEIFALRLV